MVSLSDENAMPVMSVCELCGMNFPSAAQLETHRARFCQGSGLHREVLARRNMERNAIAGNLQEDEITAISRGLAGLSDDAFGMTVSQLRDKVTREAAERTEQRLKAERAAEHAAVRLAEQRAKAEMQQSLVESQLGAQRKAELQARVQLRAAERMAEMAELRAQARDHSRDLEAVQQQQQELQVKREELSQTVGTVRERLAILSSGAVPASTVILEAKAKVDAALMQKLSAEGEERRQQLLAAQAQKQRATELERSRLRERQSILQQEERERRLAMLEDKDERTKGSKVALGASSPSKTSDETASGPSKGGGGGALDSLALRRLRARQADDERRLAQLRLEIGLQAKNGDGIEDSAPGALFGSRRQEARCQTSVHDGAVPPNAPSEDRDGEQAAARGGIDAALEELRAAYTTAGGGNPAVLQKIEHLQRSAANVQVEPSTAAQQLASSQAERPTQATLTHTAPAASTSGPPALPLPEALAAASPPVDGHVALQLAAMSRAIEAQEADSRHLEGAVRSMQMQPAGGDALSDLVRRYGYAGGDAGPAGSAARPSTREREEAELARMTLRHENELAKLRFEREILEERERLRVAKQEVAARMEEQQQQREHEAWMREQKQKLIEARMQRELQRNLSSKLEETPLLLPELPFAPYDEAAGLCVFFDFVTGLPWNALQCTLVYGLYDGRKALMEPVTLPPGDVESDRGGVTRALLALRRQFMHTAPSPSLALIVEVQQTIAPSADGGSAPAATPIGWCSVPLFGADSALRAGFWRLELFKPPITFDQHQRTKAPNIALFLRVVLTADMDRNRAFAVDPDRTIGMYRSASTQPRAPGSPSKQVSVPELIRARSTRSEAGLGSGVDDAEQAAADGAHELPASEEPRTENEESTLGAPEGAAPPSPPPAPPLPPSKPVDVIRQPFDEDKGVGVQLRRLEGWKPEDPAAFLQSIRLGLGMRIKAFLSLIQNGARQPGGIYTTDAAPDAAGGWNLCWFKPSTIRPSSRSDGMAEAVLLIELVSEAPSVGSKNAGAPPQGSESQVGLGRTDTGAAETMPPEPSSVFAWATLPLFWRPLPPTTSGVDNIFAIAPDKRESEMVYVNSGEHTLQLCPPPVQMPAKGIQLPRRDAGVCGELALCLQTAEPPAPTAKELLDSLASQARSQLDPTAEAAALNATRSTRQNNNVPPLAWLKSPEPEPPASQAAYQNEGAIVLVDGARFLPDDVVATGVRASVLDERGNVLVNARSNCLVLSHARMPRYSMRLHLCGPLPSNATIAVAVTAVVKGVEDAVTLGYAPLSLFVKHADPSMAQPVTPSEANVALNVGTFQLPLHLGSEAALAQRGVLVSEASLSSAPRLPCATVLVRVLRGCLDAATAKSDAASQLSRLQQQSVPAAPSYAAGAYDSKRCTPLRNEVDLYRQRLQRSPIQALDAIGEEADRRDEMVHDVDEADVWLERHLNAPAAVSNLYDPRGFAPYNPAAGLQVGVCSAAGLPHAAMSWAISSIYPPQGLYRNPPEMLDGRYKLTEVHDFDHSDLRAPVWKGRASHIPQVPLDPSSLLVVDIRCLEKPTTTGTLRSQGWAVLPLFGDDARFVDSGLHQLPLFDGSPTPDALASLSKIATLPVPQWQRALGKLAQEKRLKPIDGASTTITLLDAQRYGELDSPDALPPVATPERRRLPASYESRYVQAATKQTKPLRSLVGKVKAVVDVGTEAPGQPRLSIFGTAQRAPKSTVLTEQELQVAANAAFREAMHFPAASPPSKVVMKDEPKPTVAATESAAPLPAVAETSEAAGEVATGQAQAESAPQPAALEGGAGEPPGEPPTAEAAATS